MIDYDALYEQLDFPFPGFIKNRNKKYQNKKVLPNILNCEINFYRIDDQTHLIIYSIKVYFVLKTILSPGRIRPWKL